MLRYILAALILAVFLLPQAARSQGASGSPTVLYSGPNVITVTHPAGIRSVYATLGGALQPYITVSNVGDLAGCPTSHEVRVRVDAVHVSGGVQLRVIGCDGSSTTLPATQLESTWQLETVIFPDVEVGETACRPFFIRLGPSPLIVNGQPVVIPGQERILDSISVSDPNVEVRVDEPLPMIMRPGDTLRYTVCYTGADTGIHRFPVITWMRRDQPAGGYGTYAVADTGLVRVVEKREFLFSDTPIDTATDYNPPEPIVDPTTFRSIAIPNAVIPPAETFFFGTYDLLGLIAGYSVADEMMIFAGGAVPLPDDWAGVNGEMFGAFGAGVKFGTELFRRLDVAVGYVYGESIFDQESTTDEIDSRISVHSPWASISYGTDRSRASITGGYAFKQHSTWVTGTDIGFVDFREEFSRNAAFASFGADYQFAPRWKVATEIAAMQTVDVVPVILAARYFGEWFAIDLGAGYAGLTLNDVEPPAVPILPVVSALFVF